MSHAIITVAQARATGLSWYFTGQPCKRGHIAKRNVTGRACRTCAADERRARESASRAKRHRACVICGELFRPKTNAKTCSYAHLRAWRNGKGRIWKKNNPDKYAEVARRCTRQWRLANPDKVRMIEKRRKRDPSKLYEYTKKWRAAHPERLALHSNRRRMRKKAAGGCHTAEDATAILKAQRHKCASCQTDLRKGRASRDHIIPISKGGSDDRRNIQWLCRSCNSKKRNKDPLDFARENGLLL